MPNAGEMGIVSRKSIKKNYFYTVVFQLMTLVTPLITTPYVSRVLEPDGIGYYSFYNSICSYFVLIATLGTTSYGQREVSFFQDNKYERSKVFWENVILRCSTVAVMIIVWALYINEKQNRDFLIILSINIINVAVDISWFFQGMEEYGKTVGRSILFKILDVVLIYICIKNKNDLSIYVLLKVGLAFGGNLVLWSYLPKYIQLIKMKELHPFYNMKTVFSLFIPSIAIQIYTVLDKTMMGYFSDSTYQNGYYEQAMNLTKMILSLVNAMGTVLAPRTGYYYKSNNGEKIQFYLYQSYRFVWFLSVPLCLGLIGVADNFIPWFYGDKYYSMIPIVKVSSLLIIVIGLNYVTGAQYLIPTKQQKTYTKTVMIGAFSNLIINLVLIPRYFALGAVCASVIAEALIMWLQFVAIKKSFSVKKIFSFSEKYLTAGIGMFAVICFESCYLDSSWFNTVLIALSGEITYIVILFLLKEELVYENIKRILKNQRFILRKRSRENDNWKL